MSVVMYAADVDPVARVLAALALLVSIVAAVAAWQQAHGQRAANAPKVTASAYCSDRRKSADGTLTLVFETDLSIRKAVVTIRPGSAITALGAVGSTTADLTRVVLTDVANGAEIELPARFVDGPCAKLTVTMSGHGFGTISPRLDPDISSGPFFY